MSLSILLKNKGAQVFSTTPDALLCDCANLMNQKRIGALLVMSQDEELEGIITERDILRSLTHNNCNLTQVHVKDIMTHKERLITTNIQDSVEHIMDVMTRNRIRHLPVVENGKVIGIISIGDVVKHKLEQMLVENESMKKYISGI